MIKNLSIESRIRVIIVISGLLLFLPFNGMVHLFDWDEINFAESAREMIVTGNYSTVSINFIPFWEKPPLFIWMQVISMKWFGINEFAARFPNAICGILTLLLLFEMGKNLRNYKFGLIWALAFGTAILPFLYFKSGIIDPWFNLFIFSAIYFIYRYFKERELALKGTKNLIFSALILGLGVLTKGPVAILLFGTTVLIFIVTERKVKFLNWTDILLFSVVLFLSGGAYHIYQILCGNWQLVYDFLTYQLRLMKTEDAGHGGSIFYHPIVLFVGVFPASILAINRFIKKESLNNDYRRLMIILFLVVLVIFSLVQTKIVHYSSLCYFPLSYLAAITIYEVCYKGFILTRLSKGLLIFVGIIYAIIPALLQLIATTISVEVLKKYIKDDFAIACIDRSIQWGGYEYLIGVVFGIILVIAVLKLHGIKQMASILLGSVLFVYLLMLLVVPKIEKYSQAPAISMISEFQGKQVWISTLGYYSYAPFFYGSKMERACKDCNEEEFLLHGETNREVYFVTKITALKTIREQNPQLEIIKQQGGFVLLKRIDKK
jgi:4-amino-4-deoxy-L-arabinose transferase-like glycosyltransferase